MAAMLSLITLFSIISTRSAREATPIRMVKSTGKTDAMEKRPKIRYLMERESSPWQIILPGQISEHAVKYKNMVSRARKLERVRILFAHVGLLLSARPS